MRSFTYEDGAHISGKSENDLLHNAVCMFTLHSIESHICTPVVCKFPFLFFKTFPVYCHFLAYV